MANSITRRTVIQAIYSNHFVFSSNVDEFINHPFLCDNIENKSLFCDIMVIVFSLWNNYEKIFEYLEFEYDIRSVIAISIFKAFIAELFLGKVDQKILMKEYLVLLNSFCSVEAGSVKTYMNKCIEIDFFSKKNEWIVNMSSID